VRLALAAACLLAACGPTQNQPADGPVNASGPGKAPDFSIDLQNGDTFRLSEHLGKDVIVIDFWATFCVPCVAVLQHLEVAHKKHKDNGLVVLAVAMDPPETAGQIGPFVRSRGLTFNVAHDVNSQVTNLYNKKAAAPYQVLIGRDGSILKRRETYQPGDEVGMEAEIEAALAR
jgi:peroxiredoxin